MDVILVILLLTLNIFHSFIGFEQANVTREISTTETTWKSRVKVFSQKNILQTKLLSLTIALSDWGSTNLLFDFEIT